MIFDQPLGQVNIRLNSCYWCLFHIPFWFKYSSVVDNSRGMPKILFLKMGFKNNCQAAGYSPALFFAQYFSQYFLRLCKWPV